jgi:hypothetical protein
MKHWLPLLLAMLALDGCGSPPFGSGRCPNDLAGWRKPGAIGHQVPAVFVSVDEKGAVSNKMWMGYRMYPGKTAADRSHLSKLISFAAEANPRPMVILQPAASTKCADVRAIRAEMERKLACKSGQCGEGVGWSEMPGMRLVD